jgi:hypothetical protein
MPKQKPQPVLKSIILGFSFFLKIVGILICIAFSGVFILNLIGSYDTLFSPTFFLAELLGIILVFFGAMGTYFTHIIFYPDAKKSR